MVVLHTIWEGFFVEKRSTRELRKALECLDTETQLRLNLHHHLSYLPRHLAADPD